MDDVNAWGGGIEAVKGRGGGILGRVDVDVAAGMYTLLSVGMIEAVVGVVDTSI